MSTAANSKETVRPTGSEQQLPARHSENSEPDAEQIARLAYSYWEGRGCQGGAPEDDWFRAIEELKKAQTLKERLSQSD